jgi:NADPH:quinone reductase-like Zn-dependent oxidoreductase
MKAVLIRKHGGPEVLEVGDLPDPRPGPGQVVIQVKAAGMNHLDTWVRRGMPGLSLPLPMIPGSDAAGLVVEAGPGVSEPKVGARVLVSPGVSCGRCAACYAGDEPLCPDYQILGEHRNGTQAELVPLPAANLLPLPEELSFEEGAAFPLVFLTAWHMVVSRARVQAGEVVLVQAGGSGIGSAAIQISRLHGARVFATVGSDDKIDKVRALGASEVINYRGRDLYQEVRRLTDKRGVDVIVESVGESVWESSIRSLARGGRLVTCGATSGYKGMTDVRYLFSRGLSVLGSSMGNRAELVRISRLLGERLLRPVIDRVLPLERVADGHRAMADRSLFGKIVLKP